MDEERVDPEKLRDLQQKFFQEIREEIRQGYTPKQREFFAHPEVVEEGSQYVLQHRGSKAWVSACGEAIHLGMIQTEESQRGQGHARQLLDMICSLADKIGVTLTLRAEPKARRIGMVQDELVEWYGRYGFEGRWEKMTRRPRKSQGDSTAETPGSA